MSEKKQFDPAAKRNLLIIGGVMALAVISSIIILGDDPPPAEQSQIQTGDRATTEGGTKPPGYDQMAAQEEAERAKQAAAAGESYIPSLAFDAQPASGAASSPSQPNDFDHQLPPPPSPADLDAARLSAQRDAQAQSVALSRKMAAWQALNEELTFQPSVKGAEYKPATAPQQAVAVAAATVASQQTPSAPAKMLHQAGESLYAEIDMAIHTDEPSVVFAKVLSGKVRGATLFGAARLNPNNTVTIEFDKMSMPGKPQMSFRGVVVDSTTGRAALSGKTNLKIFSRYILPVLSSAAGKYSELLSKQGQTSTVVAGGVVTNSSMTSQQIRDATATAAIQQMAGAVAQNAADEKPSVELPDKLSVEVKLMQDITIQ